MSPVPFPAFRGLAKTSPGFRAELLRMADRMGLDAEPIAAVMALESGFNAQAVNPNGGATGLIQFMPATAKLLGTTTADLLRMNATDQLAYVEKFFQRVGLRGGARAGDYYVATFMPAFIGKPDDALIATAGERVYEVNKVLDRNGDGLLQVGDVRAVLDAELARARSLPPVMIDAAVGSDARSGVGGLVLAAAFGVAAWWFLKGR